MSITRKRKILQKSIKYTYKKKLKQKEPYVNNQLYSQIVKLKCINMNFLILFINAYINSRLHHHYAHLLMYILIRPWYINFW